MLDHPSVMPRLMSDPRFKLYVTTCDRNRSLSLFAAAYGADRCVEWNAGIDIDEWPDLSRQPKDIDILIYDKVRWHRGALSNLG